MRFKFKLKECFPALTYRNFRLFWSGQIVSLVGTWMQNAALSWLVYSITKDRFLLGVMSAVQFAPMLFFSLYAGILIERFPKRKIIIATQSYQLVSAIILFLMVYTGHTNYILILVILFFLGTAQCIDNPARQSFVIEMVEGKGNLMNAIALNSAAFNAARLIGPAAAGKLMAVLGAKWCFFLNAVSFIAVLIGLLMMKIEDKPARKNIENPRKDILEGLKFIVNNPKFFYTFISLIIIPTFCINFNVLLPPFTKDVLGLNEEAYGNLTSALGLGALLGSVTVAVKGKTRKPLMQQIVGATGLSAFLIFTGLTKTFSMAALMILVSGYFMVMYTTASNNMLQVNSPDYMRGRIMSVYSLVFGGLTPVGALYAGAVSKGFGPGNAFVTSGIIGSIGLIVLIVKRKVME